MSDPIVICPNEGGDGNYTWLSSSPGAQIKAALKKGGAEFVVQNGEYPFRGETDWLYVGSHSVLRGEREVVMPADRSIRVRPDASLMPVFRSARSLPEKTEAHTPDIGVLRVKGATDVVVRDIGLAGHVGIELIESSAVTVSRVPITNLTPSGEYCNMGYSRTGTVWVNRSCHNVLLDQISVVGSSHHGMLIHTGSLNKALAISDVMLQDCRVFEAGAGLLRGDSAAKIAASIRANPSREGYGWVAWPCGVDLQENAHISKVTARRLWVENAWKSGIYQEPAYPGNETTCRDLLVVDCDSVGNGFRGGGPVGSLMNVKEGEQANYFLHAATVKNCRSKRARKAGLYSMYERYENPKERLVIDGFHDIGSPYGIVLEQGAAYNVQYRRVVLEDNAVRAVQVMGSHISLDGIDIRCAPGLKVPPVMLGKMGKLINDDSRDPGNQASVKRYSAMTWTMPGLVLRGTVRGLVPDVKLYELKSGSVLSSPVIALVRGPLVEVPAEPEVPLPKPITVGSFDRIDGALYFVLPDGSKRQGRFFPDQFCRSEILRIWIEDGYAVWGSAPGVEPVVVDWVPEDLQKFYPAAAFPR